jgi:O-acetyl-ADP-ribose deacetylase
MALYIQRNDITKIQVDAIVNAANSQLQKGGGVCGAIFSAAGVDKLQQACDKIGSCATGDSVITKGFDLPSKYIIHAVGPVWQGGNASERELLRNVYISSLNLAKENKCKSIAFPLIATGIYGFPKKDALDIARNSISDFLVGNDMTVYLIVFDKQSFVISKDIIDNIQEYIDDNYVDENLDRQRSRKMAYPLTHQELKSDERLEICQSISYNKIDEGDIAEDAEYLGNGLEDILARLDETFSQMLIRLIDEKGMSDPEVYKKANIDRKLFSKIRNKKDYNPSKATVLAFSVALRLGLDEALDLLKKAGYTLSHSNKFDVIIEYFIVKENYNIFEINEALFAFDQVIL